MMKKWSFIAVVLLLVCWGGFYGTGYWRSTRHPELVNVPAVAELLPSAQLFPGSAVTVRTELALPRCRRIGKTELQTGKALTLAGTPKVSCIKGGWASRLWQVEIPLRAILPETVPAGSLQITVSPAPGKSGPEIIRITIPQMTVGKGSVPENSAVELAPEGTPAKAPRSRWIFVGIAAAVLLIALLVWIFRRKAKAVPEKSLKEKTLDALSALRGSLLKKEFPAESAVARLSDLIRNYLEIRYRMPVSKRTTPEFIEDLERNNPLPAEDQPFLRAFLNSADLIKFAQMPCDETVVNSAIASAEKLVEQTADEEETHHV